MADTQNNALELKVGIFIAVGILIFFIIVFSIGDVNFIRTGYHLNVLFNFVNGIRQGAPVRLAGVNVGEIEKIDVFFDKDEKKTKVKILVRIDKRGTKIERDSTVIINTLGLLGEKYMEILPGTAVDDFLKNRELIVGEDPIATQVLTEKVAELAESFNVVMKRLKEGKGTVGKLLTEEKIYDDLEAFVADIKKHPWKLLHKPRGTK